MLARAVDRAGWAGDDVRVLDIAAGNGVSGEALAAAGLHPVLGSDIVPSARAAALRDRPGLYEQYLILDLIALSEAERAAVTALGCNVLSCVAPVGEGPSLLPPAALRAAAALLAPDAFVAYMHDLSRGGPDAMVAAGWGQGVSAQEVSRTRYVHRYTVNGAPVEMDGVVWRLQRPG